MFKDKFKYFKRKFPPPDFSSVLDLTDINDNKLVKPVCTNGRICDEDLENFGIVSTDQWVIYELSCHPGLIVLKNPFTPKGQRYWIQKCLEDYTKPPNKNNLMLHGLLTENDNWWSLCNDINKKDKIYKQLRWVTLGYHHNWDTKVYSEDEKTVFPVELNRFCKILGRTIGNWDVDAQAAIVNFYHYDSTLSGHTDHSEPNNTAPLFSFSFGQSAIFLIGGPCIEDDATAVLVKSGDIVVMSSTSRLCYHGVPKILKTDFKPWSNGVKDWEKFDDYVSNSRINVNVRQVLFPGQEHL